jgi:hypothetical protein
MAAKKGRPQLKHVMAFPMSSPWIEIEICVHDASVTNAASSSH